MAECGAAARRQCRDRARITEDWTDLGKALKPVSAAYGSLGVSLFGVIWVGLLISWAFFAGVKPPLAS